MSRRFAPVLLFVAACGGGLLNAPPKTALRVVDQSLQSACRGLAQRLAAKGGATAEEIARATCEAEGFTRTFREYLLSQQIQAAKRAGVPVPDVNSGEFEDEDAALPAE